MEGIDRKLLVELCEKHSEFRKLYNDHVNIHERLARLEHRNYLTPQESVEEKRLKVIRLKGRERMMDILREYTGETAEVSA